MIPATVCAQAVQQQSLRSVLTQLERGHNISFTFRDEDVDGVTLAPPADTVSLTAALVYLAQHTGLTFEQLSERYVAIAKKETRVVACGRVVDAETGDPVPGATIQHRSHVAVATGDGRFTLADVSSDTLLTIRALGYTPLQVYASSLAGNPCADLVLTPQSTTLQEIILRDVITTGIAKRTDGAFSIHPAALGILPGLTEPDVLQTIQTLPGIQSINETISDINVRGGTNDQNLVLWDGIKMYHSGHFFGLISAYNPYLTERVTLTKNGTGAAWGDGVSSTIDIRTDDRLSTNTQWGAGVNLINGDAFLKKAISSKLSLHVSGRRSLVDAIRTPTYQQYFTRIFRDTEVMSTSTIDTLINKNEKFYFYDVSLKALYDISERQKLRISFLTIYNDIEYEENALIRNKLETRTSGLNQHNVATGVHYSNLWSDKMNTTAHVTLSAYRLQAINFDVENDQRLLQQNRVFDTNFKLDHRINLSPVADVFAGYQFDEVGVTNLEDINNPTFRKRVKKVVRQHAAFAEGTISTAATHIKGGVRYTYYPTFDVSILEPRFSFNQRIGNRLYLEILGEMKNQVTTQIIDLQTDFLGVEKRRWVLANDDDIPIVTSRQVSAGLHYKKERLLISVDFFVKEVDGIITSSQGFQNQYQFVRSGGRYTSSGFDFLVNESFGAFTTWLSYSYSDNTFDFTALIPPQFPTNLDITHTVSGGVSYRTNAIELSAGMNWHTGKPFTSPIASNEVVNNSINYDLPNQQRLSDYWRIDLSARYTFQVSHRLRGIVGLSLWNILNRKNIVNQYYKLSSTNTLETIQQTSLGFTPNLNVRVQF